MVVHSKAFFSGWNCDPQMGTPPLASISETNSTPSSSTLVARVCQKESAKREDYNFGTLLQTWDFFKSILLNPNLVTFCGVRHIV